MRRFIFATVVTVATATAGFVLASPAAAVGPGGWSRVGIGATSSTPSLNGTSVTALNTQNPGVLYVGGNFTSAGGHSAAKRIARWNGTSWSAVGNPALSNGAVFAIAYKAGRVYVGGTFLNAGGHDDMDFLAEWDGSTWSSPCTSTAPGPAFGGSVDALQIIGNTLYVGGSFQNGAAIPEADYLVACDLTTRVASATVVHDGDVNGGVYALAADSSGTLYAGGQFINVAGIAEADHVAAYDGTWQAMGTGPGGSAVDDYVRSLTASGDNVYVGTDALDVAGIQSADHVARWDGAAWHAVGTNSAHTNGWFPTSAFIYALATYGSIVVAAGSFQNADGIATADEIAYFDGAHWRPIGSNGAGNGPFGSQPTSLGISGGKVYAGGNFTTAGGDSLSRYLSAYALRQPDAAVGATATGHFVGNNVYSAAGTGEVRHVTITRGTRKTSYVKIQNDGLVAASFTLKGTGGARGFAVHYFHGSTNVTTAVRAGTYSTGSIAARSSIVLRLVVRPSRSSAATATFTTTAHSQAGTPSDAVRVAVRAR